VRKKHPEFEEKKGNEREVLCLDYTKGRNGNADTSRPGKVERRKLESRRILDTTFNGTKVDY